MTTIPTTTTFDDLLEAIKTKLEAIDGMNEVVIGTLGPDAYEQRGAENFYLCEIIIGQFSGDAYIAAREIRSTYSFIIRGHSYVENKDRITGTDMKAIESLGIAIKTQMYTFLDDASAPCDGFRMTNPDFILRPLYQEYSNYINTVILDINFMVDTVDTAS